ncbi:MAG: hypothetical protein GX754_10200 [Clostridiaceae bacterium]|nr:hypothetical protein [Clostridiaceae bacterium]
MGIAFWKDTPGGVGFLIDVIGEKLRYTSGKGTVEKDQEVGSLTADAEMIVYTDSSIQDLLRKKRADSLSKWMDVVTEALKK